MYLSEIISILENDLSPKIYKHSSEFYGIQYGIFESDSIINKIMLTLDLSIKAIHYAIKNKFGLIISHHGLINNSIERFNHNLVKKLTLLSKYPTIIYTLNSSLIAAEGGITDTIADALFLELDETFESSETNGIPIPIGRICSPKFYPNQKNELKLGDLIKRIKTNLDLSQVSYVGDLNRNIKKICLICGEPPKRNYLEQALNNHCECLISSRLNYHDAVFARDLNLAVIEITHYQSEIIGLKKLCILLSLEFPRNEFFLYDSKNPFNKI